MLRGLRNWPGSNQLAVRGCEILRNCNIHEVLLDALQASGCTIELAVERLAEALNATEERAFRTSDDKVIYARPQPNYNVRLRSLGLFFNLLQRCASANKHVVAAPREADLQVKPETPGQHPREEIHMPTPLERITPTDRFLLRSAVEKVRTAAKLELESADSDNEEPDSHG